ncbi:MAG: HAD-IA family hydrolase [Candidatus Promineifilaceae bacterium]
MIKALIFDVGGVLVRSGERTSRKKWERRLGLNEWGSENIVFNSEIGNKAQLGAISEESLWTWVAGQFDLSPAEFAEFREDFWADNEVDNGLMAMIRNLRPFYKTAIISNATETFRIDLTDRYQIADAFDLIVFSAEEKIMKPDPELYLRTLDRLRNKPSECIFVDDMEVNVNAAQNLGMQAIRFTPDIDLAAEFERYGVRQGG